MAFYLQQIKHASRRQIIIYYGCYAKNSNDDTATAQKYQPKNYDELVSKYYPVIIKHEFGTDRECKITEKFLTKIRYDKIKSLHSNVSNLIEEDGYLFIPSNPVDNKEIKVSNFSQVFDILKKKAKDSVNIQRYKGLGEMSAAQLSETAMNPDTRSIKRVKLSDAIEASKLFSDLMGDDVSVRREYIELHSDEAVLDV